MKHKEVINLLPESIHKHNWTITTHPSGEHTSVYAEDNKKPTTWEPDHSIMELSQQTALPLYLE